MNVPYGLVADLHCHNWQSFEKPTPSGINSRLDGLLEELMRCAKLVRANGGDIMYLAGDIFHVRGSIAPSVMNPTRDAMLEIAKMGVRVRIIPGNHDLEGKQSTRLGAAVTALEDTGILIAHDGMSFPDSDVLVIPWIEKISDLKLCLEDTPIATRGNLDLIIHAPIDGTIPGLPDHGLSPEYLAGLGFKRVFAGHYHNHKDFGNGVYSIGALAHHTWSDVKSKAGFLLVYEDRVTWFKSHLPEFVDLTEGMDEAEALIMADGNYVRAKIGASKMSEIEALRKGLLDAGAQGVLINTIKVASTARTGAVVASVSAGASIETSVSEFVKGQSFPNEARVALECQKVLSEANI